MGIGEHHITARVVWSRGTGAHMCKDCITEEGESGLLVASALASGRSVTRPPVIELVKRFCPQTPHFIDIILTPADRQTSALTVWVRIENIRYNILFGEPLSLTYRFK